MQRRNFVKLGIGASGMALLAQTRSGQQGNQQQAEQVDQVLRNQVFKASLVVGAGDGWNTVFDGEGNPLSYSPMIINALNEPVSVADSGVAVPAGSDYQVIGMPNFSEFLAQLIPVIRSGSKFDIDLGFAGPEFLATAAGRAPESLRALWNQPSAQLGPTSAAPMFSWSSPEINGWSFNIHGIDHQSLGSCVNHPVSHINIIIYYRSNLYVSAKEMLNFHLGSYRQGWQVCFVLWEPRKFNWCWNRCSPTFNDLKQWLKTAIYAAAAAIGINLAAWIAEFLSTAAAGIVYTILFAAA